jgi:hypothetical protein
MVDFPLVWGRPMKCGEFSAIPVAVAKGNHPRLRNTRFSPSFHLTAVATNCLPLFCCLGAIVWSAV